MLEISFYQLKIEVFRTQVQPRSANGSFTSVMTIQKLAFRILKRNIITKIFFTLSITCTSEDNKNKMKEKKYVKRWKRVKNNYSLSRSSVGTLQAQPQMFKIAKGSIIPNNGVTKKVVGLKGTRTFFLFFFSKTFFFFFFCQIVTSIVKEILQKAPVSFNKYSKSPCAQPSIPPQPSNR